MNFTTERYMYEFDRNPKLTNEQLSELLAEEEPGRIGDFRTFWTEWFEGKFPGNKITIVVRVTTANDSLDGYGRVIGVARFWQSPYCDNKWLIEGLQIAANNRRNGVGRALIEFGLKVLEETQVSEVFVHIAKDNRASVLLHQSVGFVKVSDGTNNSWGSYRPNIDEYYLKLK